MYDPAFTPAEVEDGKVIAAVGYLSFLFFVPLVVKPDNAFCRAHARQALVLFVGGAPVSTFSCFLHQLGGGLLAFLIFILQIVALVKALQGKLRKIPGVGTSPNELKFKSSRSRPPGRLFRSSPADNGAPARPLCYISEPLCEPSR